MVLGMRREMMTRRSDEGGMMNMVLVCFSRLLSHHFEEWSKFEI